MLRLWHKEEIVSRNPQGSVWLVELLIPLWYNLTHGMLLSTWAVLEAEKSSWWCEQIPTDVKINQSRKLFRPALLGLSLTQMEMGVFVIYLGGANPGMRGSPRRRRLELSLPHFLIHPESLHISVSTPSFHYYSPCPTSPILVFSSL